MGACAGKRKSKNLRTETTAAATEQKSPKDSPKPVIDNDPTEETDNVEISPPKSDPIDFDILILVDDVEQMASRLYKDISNALVEVSDKEFEIDLAKLVYGDPERDYVEELLSNPKFIGTDI